MPYCRSNTSEKPECRLAFLNGVRQFCVAGSPLKHSRGLPRQPEPVSESKNSSPNLPVVLLFVVTLIAITFGMLWQKERDRKPREVLHGVTGSTSGDGDKEMTADVLREVVREAVKEAEENRDGKPSSRVAASERGTPDLSVRIALAPIVPEDDDGLFYKMDAVKVEVRLDEPVKTVVSTDLLKRAVETVLTAHSIALDDKSPSTLLVEFEGVWRDDHLVLMYASDFRLQELMTLARKGDMRRMVATIWQKSAIDFVGQQEAVDAIVGNAEAGAEVFATRYLRARAKAK
jgi:hypothetical protein